MPSVRYFVAALLALCLLYARPVNADGGIPELSTETFPKIIKKADHPVLIEFKAKWCPYCKKEQADIEHLRLERMGSLEVYQVDIEDEPNIAADYDAHILPTMIILNHGVEMGRSEGALYGGDLTDWIKDVESDIKKQKAVESDSPQQL
jgi:thioredoxin 1